MIIFGVILLIIGFLLKVAIVWAIGIVVLAAGSSLPCLGLLAEVSDGRWHYW
jgi:hypothetical protein